jgi:hypothetical protein
MGAIAISLEIHLIANALWQDQVVLSGMPNACSAAGRRWMNAGWLT